MLSLNELIEFFTANKLLTKYHLDRVGIFGSIIHSDNPNDIDLLIENFSDYKDLIGLKSELESRTGKSVDIVIERFASPIIIHRAKKEVRYVA